MHNIGFLEEKLHVAYNQRNLVETLFVAKITKKMHVRRLTILCWSKNEYRKVAKMKKIIILLFVVTFNLTIEEANADFAFGELVNIESFIPSFDADHDDIVSLSSDGLEIFIESDRSGGQGGWDIWVLKRNSADEDWDPPENLGPLVNSSTDDGGACISADNLSIFFTSNRPSGNGDFDIYVATRLTRNAPWNQAENMGSEINSSSVDTYPWISADSLELYFHSKRSGGFGEYDLWVTTRTTTSDPWGEPMNLGPMINSEYNECAPCLSPDGRVLFFSDSTYVTTHRPGGYGGSDIWMTRRQTLSDPWQAPVNLGPKVNSSAHDFLTCISPDGSTLYFCTISGNIWNSWQAPITPIIDFNGDGIVNATDMCIMVEYWSTNQPLCDIGPMSLGDGIVDVQDLVVLSEYLFEEVTDPTLVAHWALDETEGMFAADSAGNNDAIVVGGTAWQPDSGQVDGALKLDGVSGYALAGAVLNPADGPFSVLVWVKGEAPKQVVVSQQNVSNWLATDEDGNLMTELKSSDQLAGTLISETVITDGQWHRIGLVWDGSHRILYVDSVIVAEDTQDGLAGSENGLNIGGGKMTQPGAFFSGLIDDVRIYSRVVSP